MTYLCAFLIECATPPVFMSTACNDLSLDAVKRSTIKGNSFQVRRNLMAKINLMNMFFSCLLLCYSTPLFLDLPQDGIIIMTAAVHGHKYVWNQQWCHSEKI